MLTYQQTEDILNIVHVIPTNSYKKLKLLTPDLYPDMDHVQIEGFVLIKKRASYHHDLLDAVRLTVK